jgi:hypothetical protein
MRTRLSGLLISTCILLSTAAQAEPASIAPALFHPIEVRVDAVLIAANLADANPAYTYPCEYDALDGRPELAAVLLEPAEATSVVWDGDDPLVLSAPIPETEAEANETAGSSTTERSDEPDAVVGALSDPEMPSREFGPDYGPDKVISPEGERSEVAETRADPLPAPDVTRCLSVSGVNPAGTDESTQNSNIILP